MRDKRKVTIEILKSARKAGADMCEVFVQTARNTQFSISDLKQERSRQSITRGFGMNFYSKGRRVFVTSSDVSTQSISDTVERAAHLVRFVDEDKHHSIAAGTKAFPHYDLLDRSLEKMPLQQKLDYLLAIEKEARSIDPRIKKASGVNWNEKIEEQAIANSNGLFGSYRKSQIQVDVELLAEDNNEKQNGEYGFKTNFYKNLPAPGKAARMAASHALDLLGGTPIPSAVMPVVLDPYASWSLLRWGVFEAVNGYKVLRKSSFLHDKLGQKIASDLVTLIDDGTRKGGAGTAPFDGEGVPSRKNVIIDKGILKMFVYDLYSARKAGTQSTGNAVRRSYRRPAELRSRNLYIQKGTQAPEQIIAGVNKGLWVKNTIGFGVDSVTGTYSIGAAGRLIENGKLTKPVSGVTIASNLADMLLNIDAVGSDLEFRYENAMPTTRISSMTVSGSE